MQAKPSTGRRERKREATRAQIVGAAKSLFAEQSYEDVSIDDITNRADVAKGTFYLHFRTKEHVADAVYNDLIRPDIEEIDRSISDGSSARELLFRFFKAAAAPAESHPRLTQVAFSHSMSEVYAEPQDTDDLIAAVLMKIVARGQASGELRSDWPKWELAMMLGVLFGTAVWAWTAMPTGEPLADRLRRCLETCLDGMAARPEVAG